MHGFFGFILNKLYLLIKWTISCFRKLRIDSALFQQSPTSTLFAMSRLASTPNEPMQTKDSLSHSVEVTREQAQRIISSYVGRDMTIMSLEPMSTHGFSFTPTQSYTLRLENGETYALRVRSPPSSSPAPIYAPNTLATEAHLISLLARQTSIPHRTVHRLDESMLLVPYHYLLLSHSEGIPLARVKSTLTDRQRALLDLRLGVYYKQLHSEVQNDWFGLPSQEKDELYSWQEAFTYLLESLLHEAKDMQLDIEIPFEDVRRYLSRAIGSFLFDDCEVPSLVSFTADEEDILVEVEQGKDEVKVTSLISLSHALWGDPLLECIFMEGPSTAFLEGYGGSPVVFARQRTKRLWYTLFLAVMIVTQVKKGLAVVPLNVEGSKDGMTWARDTILRCIEKLKDAPCY